MTIHSCEEKLKVPYRFWKVFKGKNIDTGKEVYEKMFVRHLNEKEMDLKQKKILKKLKNEKKLFLKKCIHSSYSIVNLNEYYLKNLNYLPSVLK